MTPPDDPRAALAQLVVRLRGAAPADRAPLVQRMLPLLAKPGVPLAVRYAAAGRAIEALPDQPGAIRGVVRALTGRLTAARALARLRHLQHLTERSDALDALVAKRERKVKLTCPRCDARLPRADMAKHLWHEHGLELTDGKVRTAEQAVEALQAEHAKTGDPALLDRAATRAGEPGVRAWAARTATEEETVALCGRARERGASLCPGCFADVPPVVPELPPVLAVANGRLAGDGFTARAPALSPTRIRATLLAAGVMLGFGWFAPQVVAFLLSAAAYLLGLFLFRAKGDPNERAIDAAWKRLARKLVDRRDAATFLARLCVTSAGRGDPFERANALNALVARARANPAEHRLLAVALALRVTDGAKFGRDRAAGVAEVVAPVFRGEQPADFAEHALALYFRRPRDPGEVARLRVLLLAAAFEAERTPDEVLALCAAAPHLARAMRLSPNHVALLYGIWSNRTARVWENIGKAKTVFKLAAESPTTAARFLRDEPGLALVCDSPPGARELLGPVLISLTGVSLGRGAARATVADAGAAVKLEARGRVLVFGKAVMRVNRPLPAVFVRDLKLWLRFRAEVLAGYPAEFLSGAAPAPTPLLKPFVARCRVCRTACLPVVGAVAHRVKA